MPNVEYDLIIKLLYKLAIKSYKAGDIPVAAVVIKDNIIIGKGYNTRQSKYNVCGHAEINAILEAEKYIKDWRLNGCILISTLKPCEMCNKIIDTSRIDKVYYLLEQDNLNYDSNNYQKLNFCNKYVDKYQVLFNSFFKEIR